MTNRWNNGVLTILTKDGYKIETIAPRNKRNDTRLTILTILTIFKRLTYLLHAFLFYFMYIEREICVSNWLVWLGRRTAYFFDIRVHVRALNPNHFGYELVSEWLENG